MEKRIINYKNNDWGWYSLTPTCFVIHNTHNSASADNEVAYLSGRTGGYATYHIAVDENKSIQALPFDINAWAAGDGTSITSLNRTGIHIEVCRSTGGDHDGAYNNMIKLVAQLSEELGIEINEHTIKFHNDAGTKYCPHKILDEAGSPNKARENIITAVNEVLNKNNTGEIEDMEITWEKENRARALVGTIDNAKFSGDKIAKFIKTTNIYTDITCDTRNASKSYFEVGDIVVGYSVGWQTRKTGARVLVYKFINSVGAIYYTIIDQK